MITRAFRLLIRDPSAFASRVRLRLAVGPLRRLPFLRAWIVRIGGVRFRIDLRLDPRMRQMARGTYQPDLIAILGRFLGPGDTFVDVGANVGYVSAHALALVGASGAVHAFEPVPRYRARLERIRADNPGCALTVNGVALGAEPGTAAISVTNLPNIGWNTMVPGFMAPEATAEVLEVPVTTLDAYLAEHGVPTPRLVKIDTEGFESPVLRGFERTIRAAAEPPVLVVEVAPAAYATLGTSLGALAAFLADLGYAACDLRLTGSIDITTLARTTDVAFLPAGLARSIGLPPDGVD